MVAGVPWDTVSVRRLVAVAASTAALLACTNGGGDRTADQATFTEPAVGGSDAPATSLSIVVETSVPVSEPQLRSELLAMMQEDQAEQTGQVTTDNYSERTTRLAEILDQYGWPRVALVGEDGSTAAWVIAQHADLDVELQQRALDLLTAAAEDGQASRGDAAYLADRVAVAVGSDQQFGTQIRCDDRGTPVPATPIADEAGVDSRRRQAGLPPLQDYINEMTTICAADG